MVEQAYQLTQAGTAQVVSLTVPESMDNHDFDQLNAQILDLIASEPHARWVLDLTGLNHVGSATLGLLVNIRQRVRTSGGQLVLCGLSQRLLRIFQTCCMERLFIITKTRADAVKEVAR